MKEQLRGGKRTDQEESRENEDSVDRLTGLRNECSTRSRITEKMQEGGSLFLCDIDRLRRVNDQFGHFEGDECLKQVARTLGYMIRSGDILGRIGGDEFVIFVPGCRDRQTAEGVRRRIEARFRTEKRRGARGISLSVMVGIAVRQNGDSYQKLLKRAEEELARRREEAGTKAGRRTEKPGDNYQQDVKQIREDLMEQIRKPGAYCQDYETFKCIYRFLERGLVRSGQKACVILMTLVDGEGRSISPHEKDVLMEQLGKDIHEALRVGDVYTRYSSSQYLVLVIDTTEEVADMVADRVKERFLPAREDSGLLVHYCYALRPARILELEKEQKV